MALETVTGFITSFARNTDQLPGLQLAFVPTGNGVNGDHLFVTREAPATLTQSSGAFTVQLERSAYIYGAPDQLLRYYPRITWQNGAGRFLSQDFVHWKIPVPAGGGSLEDLVNAVVGNDMVYTSPTALDVSDDEGHRVYSGFQLNTVTGVLYKRVDS